MATVNDMLKNKGNKLWVTHPDATIREALEMMTAYNVGGLPVVKNDKVVGFFSERDFARHAINDDCFDMSKTVEALMVHPVYFVDPEQKVEECMAVMTTKKLRHLPVMENGKMIGIVSIGDVVKHLLEEKQETIDLLEHFLWVNMI
ncbi:MAG: histidine kinase [Chloroflexi bacterium HGW-Chloroflexi-2]|jgi:CBS domain-containing protein|nr:MAG: histidine kinase [Chloroflexi bacterium HGW-Chloroflexi-2]